jgi:nitrile hydratase
VTNSIHDMGGMHGFGPVEIEDNEPVFHEAWEGRVYAMQRSLGKLGLWTIDMSRASQEMLPPATYVSVSYYQRWYLGLHDRVLSNGLATKDEIAAGHAQAPGREVNDIFTPANVATMTRGSYFRPSSAPPRFKAGDRVRTRNINPETHTRLPRYARDKVGVVEAERGCCIYPDTVAIGEGENPQWLYTVVFSGQELWGPDSDPATKVSIEAFEPYLEAEPA